jgi:general stress protein 26
MSDLPDKVREVMKAVSNIHVLATVDEQNAPRMRWMGALVEDPEHPWTFYLACGKESRKMAQIAGNDRAQLLFTNQDSWEVATLSGSAEAVDSVAVRQLLWEGCAPMRRYYKGVDDPTMGIICFTTRCLELLTMAEHKTECFVFE